MGETVLNCDGVGKSYGGVVALKNVCLELREGEILGLVGANGSGKTTLLDIVCGSQTADRGDVTLRGKSLRGLSPSQRSRRGIARTFQMPQVARDLTITENVLCGLASRHLTTARSLLLYGLRSVFGRKDPSSGEIDEVCSSLGLHELDRPVEQVSFGEMRLIEVARAVIQEPSVLLLDEPFPAVGEEGLQGMLDALQVVKSDGASVVLIDHNVDLVGASVDRIVLLADGEMVIEGDPIECMKNPIFLDRYIGAA